MKHTDGNFHVDGVCGPYDGTGDGGYILGHNRAGREIYLAKMIDSDEEGQYEKNKDRRVGNAALFAAAPELLAACEALKAAYDAGEESESIEWEDLDSAHTLAVDALKKLTG